MADKPIMVLDFDGVCHLYTSGWKGIDVIPDDAVPGLFDFIDEMSPHFDIQIFSSRSKIPKGVAAMAFWMCEQRAKWLKAGGNATNIVDIKFPTEKPPAFITIDDRSFMFKGQWPSLQFLQEFKPWNG
jgi:hypothetical protein